jgi:hypothetical protein
MDPEKIKAAIEAIKNGDGDAALAVLEAMIVGEPAEPEPAPEPLVETPDPEPAKPEDQMVASALMRLTATTSASEAIAEATRRLARDDAREAENATAELSARRDLVAELVKCGAEFPSTAWEGDAKDRNPVKRLADEPIGDLRARVALHRKNPRTSAAAPPVTRAAEGEIETPLGPVMLSARERAMCAELKLNVNDYAAQKAAAKKA